MKWGYKIKRKIFFSLILLALIGLFLGMYLFYPDILWDVRFSSSELSFCLDKSFSTSEDAVKYIPDCQNCNIILISLDTLRADHLGSYGYDRETSPNIDKLVDRSILFKNIFSNAYFTLPSHISIFTSLYPTTHRINDMESTPLSTNFETFAEIFKKNGYRTIWFGPLTSSHLNLSQGSGRGFDEFYPSYFSQTTYFSDSNGFNRTLFSGVLKQDLNKRFFLFLYSYVNHAPYIYPEPFNSKFSNNSYSGRLPKDYPSLTKLCLNELKKSYKNNPDNFFSQIPMTFEQKTRLVSYLNSENINQLLNLLNEAGYGYLSTICYYHFLNDGPIEIIPSDEDISEVSNTYDNGVYYADYLFGGLLNELAQLDLLDNTIIVITADHGEELFEHKGFGHDNFYDHTIHVPLIIYVPGLKKKVGVSGLMQSIDILPTVLNLAGIKSSQNLQGKDVLQTSRVNDNSVKYAFGYSLGDMYVRSKSGSISSIKMVMKSCITS